MIGPYELNRIYTGDARKLAEAIPAESIDLIITDPVYDRIDDYAWLAETAARLLKPDSWLLVYIGIGYLPEIAAALAKYLDYEWAHVNYMPSVNQRGSYMTFNNYRVLLRYKKGEARPNKHLRDLHVDRLDGRSNPFKWAKNTSIIKVYIDAFCDSDSIIVDPFAGGGSVPAACKESGRSWLAFEIDPATADLARRRVAETQPPLPLIMPDQMKLDL